MDIRPHVDLTQGPITLEKESRIQWVPPFSFSKGGSSYGISGNWNMAPFIDEVSKIILNLPNVGPAWWIERCVAQRFGRDLKVGEQIDLKAIDVISSVYKIKIPGDLSTDFIRVAHHYGLEYSGDAKFKRVSESTPPTELEGRLPGREAIRRLAIPEIPLPDRCDPRIYRPSIGTHMNCSGTTEQWEHLMEWEGRSDADCVLRYLTAYNSFIREPTGARLIEATRNPRTGTDPYFLAMTYIADVFAMPRSENEKLSPEQTSIYELLSLMHAAFMTSFSLEAMQRSDLELCDRRLYDGLAYAFAATHASLES